MNHSYSASSGARKSAPGSRSFYAKKGPSPQRHERGKTNTVAARGGRIKQYIDPKRFVKAATAVETTEYVSKNSFHDFAVHPRILANVLAKGYKSPTAIQDQTIPLVMEGRDVVGLAATGTGKTAAFAVPMIHDLMMNQNHRALIMAPTRELAQQIMEECLSFSKGCSIRGALLIGGASMHLQKRDLRYNPSIIVGTPGRIKDHLRQGTLQLRFFNYAVLDEVDRMLDMGFINDITSILGELNPVRQSLFFSATMEPKIERLIKGFAKDPVTVSTVLGTTADGVNQNVVYYSGTNDKLDKLHELLIKPGCSKTIIFDDTKRAVERLGRELNQRGFKVDYIHGDKSQAQRARAIKQLKTAEIDVLVATDVAARGIDVADVSHVVNYSTPNSYDDYIHRIGRTGRAGKTGYALTFLPA